MERPREEPRVPVFRPDVDVLERPDEIVVRADLPGVPPDGIDVRFENGVLTLRGQVRRRGPEEPEYLLQEYEAGDYADDLDVGEAIDAAGIRAECADGVLTVRLPKAPAARPRRIEVRAK
jgi:HSP20 family protein